MKGDPILLGGESSHRVTRRTLLRSGAAAATVGMTGCAGLGGSGDGTPTGTGTGTGTASGTSTLTDMAGRTVTVPATIDEIIAVGAGAVRAMAQMGAAELIVGVEERETTWLREVPYNMANPRLREQPVIGGAGGDPEQIVAQDPDVLFSTGGTQSLNTLQEKTNIPTVGIGVGEFIDIGAPSLGEVWTFIGETLGAKERANQRVSFLDEVTTDYTERTKGIMESEMPSVYVAAINFRGGQGFTATRPLFGSFELLGPVNNVASNIEYEGIPHVTVSKEQLLEWDPKVVFVDQSNTDLVKQEIDKNPELTELTAIQEGNVHGILPHAQYALNHTNILANTYYMGKVMYPDAFGDVAVEQRADEIYRTILGEPLYQKVANIYGGLKPVDVT